MVISLLIANIIQVLLDHNGLEYDSFTAVTMELPEESGIEPDYCFYIDYWEAVSFLARNTSTAIRQLRQALS
jgi:Uma2 family endonuclease